MAHDRNVFLHLNPKGHSILYSVLAQAIYRLSLFPRRRPLLKRNAVLFLHLTYYPPSICRFAVSGCPVRYWQVMREVDANVEIGNSFCVMLAVYTAPAAVAMVLMASVMVLVDYTGTVFSVRPFDVQSKCGRVGGM